MAADPMLERVIQPQRLLEPILDPHFATASLARRPTKAARSLPDRTFETNEAIWHALISERLRGHMAVTLRGFHVFEWFPRAPGLYHTEKARSARQSARDFFDPRFSSRGSGEHTAVFLPEGKLSMLEGGVGCVRLKPLERDGQILWWLTASSSTVAHEGFPIALPHDLFESVIDTIRVHGAVTCDLRGHLRFLPDAFEGLYSYPAVPQLYLEVDAMEPKGCEAHAPEVSVAVSFMGRHRNQAGVFATYVTFTPGRSGSLEESLEWMKHTYVEGLYHGKILTDFDQVTSHFPEAKLSLRKVMNRMLTEGELREAIDLTLVAGNIGRYVRALDLEQLRERVGVVARTRVFISYSHRDRQWKDRMAVHLQPLVRQHSIDDWSDDRIPPGADWEEEIDSAIESARVAILLISANFMASDFIQDKELPKLIAAAERRGLTLFPVLIGACAYAEHARLGRYQAVHDVRRPLNQLSSGKQDQVFDDLRRKLTTLLRAPSASES